MRVHIPSLPHTETTREWQTCAFTTKIRHLCDMLMSKGHEVFLYAGEENEANCTEHIIVSSEFLRKKWFGEETYKEKAFDRWELNDVCWIEFNNNVIFSMMSKVQPGDFLALPLGQSHELIARTFPNILSFESGIGYQGIIRNLPHVFESYAWMHDRYGEYKIKDGRFFDVVIPNAFDPDDFYLTPKQDYLLFLGRHTSRKGLSIVEEIAKHYRVLTAGQGDEKIPGTEYVGVVKGKERAELIAGARALLAPTVYIEPFGGVVVEAQMSGTVPITTNFGAFTETINDGINGFRCSILSDFLKAVEQSDTLEPSQLRQEAIFKYSKKTIANQYDAYLNRLQALYGDGWYT